MRYVIIDIETTSLEPSKGQIIEFAAIVDDTEWWQHMQPIELPHISFLVDPGEYIVGQPAAIKMNMGILEDLERCRKSNDYEKRI